MAKLTKKAEKALDAQVNRAYAAGCSGITIPLMSIPKVFAVGRKALDEGKTGDELEAVIRAYVETIRTCERCAGSGGHKLLRDGSICPVEAATFGGCAPDTAVAS